MHVRRRIDKGRVYGRHGYAGPHPELVPQRTGKARHTILAGGVGHRERHRHPSCERGDVDDHTLPTAIQHRANRRVTAVDDADEVDLVSRAWASGGISSNRPHRLRPAMLTQTSMRPTRSSAARASACMAVGSVTSAINGRAWAPSALHASAAFSSSASRRAASTTLQCRRAKASAVASPIPQEAPAITTVRPRDMVMEEPVWYPGWSCRDAPSLPNRPDCAPVRPRPHAAYRAAK